MGIENVIYDDEPKQPLAGEVGDETVEPAAELPEVLDAVFGFIKTYVICSDEQTTAVSLFIAHTYVMEAAETTPYLHITSPEKQSGKTRLLEVLAELVHRPIRTANISDAALFRSLVDPERGRATLLFDEVGRILHPSKKAMPRHDLIGMLNEGYRRGAVVQRCEGEGKNMRVRDFDVFSPKALAGLGEIPDELADRSIPIRLQRKRPEDRAARFRFRKAHAEAEGIRKALAAWAARAISQLRDAEPDLPDQLTDRQQDCWEPLLAIADLVGEAWDAVARDAAQVIHCGDKALESGGVELLRWIGMAFDEADTDRLKSEDLVARLNAYEEAPFGGYGRNGMTPRDLARKLRAYGIRPRVIRLPDGSTPRGYRMADFTDAWVRYLPHTPRPSSTSATPQVNGDISSATDLFSDSAVAEEKRPLTSEVAPVADKGGTGGLEDGSRACQCGGKVAEAAPSGLTICSTCGLDWPEVSA